jgi:hypothetical protein
MPKADARFQTADNSQDQRPRPLFFRAQCGGLKDFCERDEIDG